MSKISEHSCLANFPEFARVNRVIPKEKFYDQIDYATKMLFQHEIARITWQYKLAPGTVNLSAKTRPELEVIQIELKNHEIPMKILKVIDSAIPYPILFIVTKGLAEKAIIGYKELNRKNENTAKVDTYFATEWNDPKLSQIKIDGLDIDMVYNNLIRQIAGERLQNNPIKPADSIGDSTSKSLTCDNETALAIEPAHGNTRDRQATIQEDIARLKAREKIQKQIDALDRKIKSEPSIGKRQKLAEERYNLLQRLQ